VLGSHSAGPLNSTRQSPECGSGRCKSPPSQPLRKLRGVVWGGWRVSPQAGAGARSGTGRQPRRFCTTQPPRCRATQTAGPSPPASPRSRTRGALPPRTRCCRRSRGPGCPAASSPPRHPFLSHTRRARARATRTRRRRAGRRRTPSRWCRTTSTSSAGRCSTSSAMRCAAPHTHGGAKVANRTVQDFGCSRDGFGDARRFPSPGL
jgi:hypothetical protein